MGLKGNEKKKKKPTRKNGEKQLQSFEMAKMEKMCLICGQQLRRQPGWEPKAACPCSQLGHARLPLVRSLHWPPLAEQKRTFLSL